MRAKKQPQTILRIYDGENTILERSITMLELPDKATIAMSIEYYMDPDPCEIHREAIRQMVVVQLIEKYLNRGSIFIKSLPENLRLCFPEGNRIEIWEKD